jgi:UDP-N-acetylmuramyl pentapeptide phosphotransferase/UDP-N-acetylglucosamine-1-phosphate transferase
VSLWYVNQYIQPFTNPDFIIYPFLANIVFLFFNFRKHAKCFAGDVGSIAIAFWVIYLLLQVIIASKSIIWILFLAVYGVDTVCTIAHRMYPGQNIFEAHRLHFYQILGNQYGIQHRVIAIIYALIQLVISCVVVFAYTNSLKPGFLFAVVLVPLVSIYSFKFYLLKKVNSL